MTTLADERVGEKRRQFGALIRADLFEDSAAAPVLARTNGSCSATAALKLRSGLKSPGAVEGVAGWLPAAPSIG